MHGYSNPYPEPSKGPNSEIMRSLADLGVRHIELYFSGGNDEGHAHTTYLMDENHVTIGESTGDGIVLYKRDDVGNPVYENKESIYYPGFFYDTVVVETRLAGDHIDRALEKLEEPIYDRSLLTATRTSPAAAAGRSRVEPSSSTMKRIIRLLHKPTT